MLPPQVLENFHVATAFQIMKHEGFNILEELSIADAVRFECGPVEVACSRLRTVRATV